MATNKTIALQASPVAIITAPAKGKRVPAIRLNATQKDAIAKIETLAFVEALSRADNIANMRAALGKNPSEAHIANLKQHWIIGTAAAKMPIAEMKKAQGNDVIAQLAYVRELVTRHGAPAEPGKKARALNAGLVGRRTPAQHTVIRNAEKAWSLFAGDCGIGQAQGLAEKKAKAKRAPHGKVSQSSKGASVSTVPNAPDHSALVQPKKAMTADEAVNHVMTQGATLAAWTNSKAVAKVLPAGFGEAILAFKSALNKAANDYELLKAKADAERAAKEK